MRRAIPVVAYPWLYQTRIDSISCQIPSEFFTKLCAGQADFVAAVSLASTVGYTDIEWLIGSMTSALYIVSLRSGACQRI